MMAKHGEMRGEGYYESFYDEPHKEGLFEKSVRHANERRRRSADPMVEL